MSETPLTTVETSALLILLAEAGPVPNVKLTQDHHCQLKKKSREKLEQLKLIEVERSPRLVLTLSEKGWAHCRAELATGSAPARSGAAGGALYAVLRRWDRFLAAHGMSLSEFVTAPEVSTANAAPSAQPVEERLVAAYRTIAGRPGDLVSLADLRDLVSDLAAAEVDAALRRLHRRPGVTLVPEANQKMLDARTRAAAVVIGDQPKHVIAMGAS